MMESPGVSPAPRSADDRKATHIFTELRSHDDLLLPVRGSKRLKYTCITCSRQYIALGASHGGLYIFQRDTLKYLQQIGNKERLTKALFSPNENVVGMATSGGAVIVWNLNIRSRQKPERIAATKAHWNRQIASLCWDDTGLRLFSGDERGRITVTNTDSSKPSGIFKFQSEQVTDVDSSIVQMNFTDERLLVSTMTRCYLCDPKKGLTFQIGTKLRDGAYGACFLKTSGSEKPSVFCARPGSRIWEANTLCQVLHTHQFKQLLARPPLPVMGKGREVKFPSEDAKHPPQSLAFPILHPLGNHFLVTWNDHGVYVFDPVNVHVVFWTSDISGLVDVSVSKSSLYCLHKDGNIRKYTLQNIARCAASLYQQSLLVQCSRLVLRFQALFQRSRSRHHMPPHVLHELAKRVAAEDSILGCEVEELAVSAENRVLDVPSTASSRRSSFDSYDGMRLQSGIYVVRRRPDSECSDDLPLGYDAHMEMQGNSEWTEKSREETILETSPVNVETDAKEDSPTEDIKLEVAVSSCVEDATVNPKDETLIQEDSAMEISKGGTGSRDPDLGDSTTHEQRRQEKDKSDALVIKEEDSDVSKENSPAGENMVVEENASTGEGLQEDVNKLDKHIAVIPRFAEKEIGVHRHEADSNLLSMTSIAQSDDSSSHGIHKAFEEEPVEQEKVLKDQNALTSQLESGTGSHSLSLVSSFQNDVISTPNQDAFKKSEADLLEQDIIQNDGNIDDVADVHSAHQSDHTAAEDHIGCRQNIDVPPLQEISTTTDVIVNVGAPAVDDSSDQQSVSLYSNIPGQDLGEVGTLQDKLMIGGIGFDSPLVKHETKDSGATEECQHVGLPEINQRKTLSNALENSHSTQAQVTSILDLNMEVSGRKTDKEVALVYMQSHRDMDSEREISQRDDEEGTEKFRNQKFVKDIVANYNKYETKELCFSENFDSLSEPCREDYRAGRESESQVQDLDLITQTAADSHTTKHQHCSSEEALAGLLKLPTQTDESTPIDVSGFGLDVSGFGISPRENSFNYPNQGEQNRDQSASAQQPMGYDRIPPDKRVDHIGLPKDLHKSSDNDGYLSSASENKEDQVMMSYSGEKRSEDREIWAQQDSILASEESSTIDHHHSNVITKLASHYHSNQAEQANFHEEDFSNLVQSTLSSSNYAMDDSLIDSASMDESKDSASKSGSVMSDVAKVSQSLLSKEGDSSIASSLENLEIVREDDLEMAEGDCQFPNAETELIKSVTESRYTQHVAEQRDRSMSLEKINQEPSDGNVNTPSAPSKRKKTKSRIIDITETVSKKPSPLHNMAPGSVLYRPTSLPDLSPQSSSQSYPLQRTPSSTIPSPALSPTKEARRPSPASSALPSPNLIIAATSGLPHSTGLMETQQIILSSTAQINLKAVKNSLTSKLSKTKTFLQSMGDSNPLSPKEGDHRVPPMQPPPSPSSSPISGSPTHRKGTVASKEIPHLHSSSSPQPSLVSSPQRQPQGDFPDELMEEAKEDQVDSRLGEDLIEATNTTLLVLRDPQTSFSPDAVRGVLQSWVNKLEQTYRSCQAEGIIPWSKGHLAMTGREDLGCLAMQCFIMDIYANEERFRNSDEETAPDPGSLSERGEEFSDSSELGESRAAFIKRHFTILDRQRILEVLQYKQGCHNSALRILLQYEEDEARNSNTCEALDNENVQEAFDLLFRADLTSSNLPLSLCFLRRLCSLDSGRALDMMISDYPTINPWHVYHILQYQPQFKFLLLDYVESSLITHPPPQRKKFIEQVISMKPLAVSLAEAALTFDPPNSCDLFCDCGELPKLGSHLIKWSHDQILDLVLFSSSVPQDILLQLFLKAGYWHGAIILIARERGGLMDALKLCIQLGDDALISSSQNNLIPSTEEEWRNVLEWMKKCQPSKTEENNSAERKCLNCGISLSVCNLTRPVASEELSEVVVKVEEQETDGTEERLSPSSQPECDWSVTDPLEPSDQSGSLMETCASSKGVERSDAFDGDAENSKNGNHQSEDIEDLSTPQENNLENPSTIPSPSALSDSDWLPTVTWQRIALLLVSHLGAVKGVKLLREVQVPEGMLGREFHQMCLYVSMWEKRQSLLSYAMLEGTDAYLWSKRQPLLGPRLQHLIMKEYQGVRQGCADTASEGERVLKAQKVLSQDQLYIEDPGTHWGRTTNLGRICRVCHQSLAWSSVLHSAGCIIFPCGHVFHTLCVPEKACILCFYGNRGIKL